MVAARCWETQPLASNQNYQPGSFSSHNNHSQRSKTSHSPFHLCDRRSRLWSHSSVRQWNSVHYHIAESLEDRSLEIKHMKCHWWLSGMFHNISLSSQKSILHGQTIIDKLLSHSRVKCIQYISYLIKDDWDYMEALLMLYVRRHTDSLQPLKEVLSRRLFGEIRIIYVLTCKFSNQSNCYLC